MKRNLSFAVIGIVFICSMGIGLSSFSSGSVKIDYGEAQKINQQTKIEDFGTFKFNVDQAKHKQKISYNYPVDDAKSKNKLFQLIRWDQMEYHNRL